LPLVVNGVVPEVEARVRIYYNDRIAFEFNGKRFNDNHIIYTDSTFFDVFSFKLLSGNPHQDLSTKSNLYISQSLALKVFGTDDVVEKMVTTKNYTDIIAGVFEDISKS
jgi:putative ABC transport system permease protein